MRIKTQFTVAMALFAGILVVVTVSAIVTNQKVEQASRQERIASAIAQGASNLGHLSNDYLIYRESQQLVRWQAGFAAFSGQVAVLQADTPEQQSLVAGIRASKDRMKAVFDSVAATSGRLPGNGREVPNPTFLQVSWSRMAVQTQALAADALRLSKLLHREQDRLTNARTLLLYAMIGLFGVFLLAGYLFANQRILKSIAALRAGAAIIGSGNLDFTIEERKNDEIGELSRAMNRMASDLKALTASRTDLEREIDERKRAEKSLAAHAAKLEEVNRELESFSYSVSHDLRAPLRAIDGYSRMILKKQEDRLAEDAKRQFQVIRDNVEKMGKLIDDLLGFSRLGRQEVVKANLDLDELIREVWCELVTINPGRAMSLKVDQMPAPSGDRALMQQVYGNLLGNAVKFTKTREAAEIEAGSVMKDNETVYYVKDNGIGFDMKFHDKLFGVFQRLHSDAEYEGTGIGLALVQRIIHRQGGRVWAEGEVDKGATFFFTLPT